MMRKVLLFLFLMTSMAVWAQGKGVFTTDRSKLIDADGHVFVIRGMNNPHAWFGEKGKHIRDNANRFPAVYNEDFFHMSGSKFL